MPRKVRHSDIENRTARRKLAVQHKPYYRLISQGKHLGYRKGKTGGVWIARRYSGSGKYETKHLGIADDIEDANGKTVLDFTQALEAARSFFAEKEAGITYLKNWTVSDALDDYLEWFQANRRSYDDTSRRIEVSIRPALGSITLRDLRARDIEKWMNRQATTPARLRSAKGANPRFKVAAQDEATTQRSRRATANRLVTILKAALNRAWNRHGTELGIANDTAWRAAKPFRDVTSARLRYLELADCKRLANACPADFRRLTQAALLTGCRYGELCAMQAGDFSADASAVMVRHSKSGQPRHVYLSPEGLAFFDVVTAGKAPDALLFTRADGTAWKRAHQGRPLRDACNRAKITPPISFHGLRHTYASQAVMHGVPLQVLAENLGHSDTRMVERHYGHLSDHYKKQVIAQGIPSFGFERGNITQVKSV